MENFSKRDLLPVFLLLCVSILAQAIYINPPVLSDQMQYYYTAVKFPHLPDRPSHWSLRIGLILPVAVLYRIFGHAEFTYYFIPFLSTSLLIINVYIIGNELFNRRVGFFSALWLIWIPGFLLESGHLLPDIPATACITSGISLILLLRKSNIKDKKKLWLFILCGAFFGWAYLIKEYFLVFFILAPLMFLIFEIPFKYLLPVATGALLIAVIEFTFGYIYYGDIFIRLTTASPRLTWGYVEKDILRITTMLFYILSKWDSEGMMVLSLIAVFHSFSMSLKRIKRHIFLSSWIVLIYCFFTSFGLLPAIFDWKDLVLLRLHHFRYWVPILPPLIIGGIAAIEHTISKILFERFHLKKYTGQSIFFIIIILLLSASIRGVSAIDNYTKNIRGGGDHYLELRDYLAEHGSPQDVIWIVRDLKIGYDRILPIYIHNFWGQPIWSGTFKYLNTNGEFLLADEITYGGVIIDRVFFNPDFNRIPLYLAEPPTNWEILFESENDQVALYTVN